MALERSLPAGAHLLDGVAVEEDGPIRSIWLYRPERLNATTEAMVASLHEAISDLAGVRLVVLGGVGRAFSAGRDLKEAHPGEEDGARILREVYHPLLLRLASLEVPTLAVVHGAALGTGLGLAFACDLVLAATSARIGSPFARIGAVLDSGGHAFLAPVGTKRLFDLVVTGELMDGAEAARDGLVSRALAEEGFEEEVARYVGHVAAGPTAAFVATKQILATRRIAELAAALEAEATWQGRIGATADYREGITAFQEGRAPRFEGR